MKFILSAVDFSTPSSNALNYAAAVANTLQSALVILHVYELPVLYGDAPFLAMQQLSDEIKNTARQNLDRTELHIQKEFPSLEIKSILRHGNPVSEIIEESEGAAMIVMGTKGQSTIERLLIGSTTERVFHHSSVPVLCIPAASSYHGINHMFFATDLQEDNLTAAETVVEFASAFKAAVEFIYINRENDEAHELREDELTQKMRERFAYPFISGAIVDDDDVSKGLQSFIEKNKADLLCMYTHERSFPRALLMPSVTSRALHRLNIPLLVLHQHS